jgi:predicted metal-binding membrane protein
MTDAALEAVLRRDRILIVGALLVLVAPVWAYVIWLAADMEMGGHVGISNDPGWARLLMMPVEAPWQPVMMLCMMTPSAAPMISIYARIARKKQTRGG